MKIISYLIFLMQFSVFSQTKGRFNIYTNVTLDWEIQEFEKSKHKFDYCIESGWKYICKIDDSEWFGSDLGMEYPKNQLAKLVLTIGNQKYQLLTSKMFNPNFSGYLDENQFKLVKYNDYFILYSFFSDGAGSYSAHWKIKNDIAERIVLSNDEKYFEWQLD